MNLQPQKLQYKRMFLFIEFTSLPTSLLKPYCCVQQLIETFIVLQEQSHYNWKKIF